MEHLDREVRQALSETPAAFRNTEEQLVRPDIDPGNAYRRLLPTDILRTGDEYWCNGEWYPTGDPGYYATELPYRRLRDAPNVPAYGRAVASPVQQIVGTDGGDI